MSDKVKFTNTPSDQTFREIFDITPVGMMLISEKGEVLEVNNAICKATGYTVDDLKHSHIDKLTKAKIPHNNGSPSDLHSIDLVHKDNSSSKVDVSIKTLAPGVNLLTIEKSIDDISRNNLFFEALMDELPFNIYFKNKKSEFLQVSKNKLHRMGKNDQNEVVGKTDFDFFSQSHAKHAYDDEQEIIKTGKHKINFEEEETWPDGSVTWVSTSKHPLKDFEDNIIGTFGISRDITKQKLQEREIKDKTRILNAITSNMPVAIYKYSKSKGITALFGDTEIFESFYNSKVARIKIADSLYKFADKIRNRKDQQSYYNFPSTYDSEEREWYFNNYIFEAQNSEEFIGLALDVSEKKISEQNLKRNAKKLEKINKELNQFAYIVSHDLKAPLRAITNLSAWIEEDLGDIDNEDVTENLALLRNRVQRMENLINGILTYSRVSRSQTEEEEIDTEKLLNEIIATLDIPETIELNIKHKLPVISFSKVHLEQIFTNLITNAVKHRDSPEGEIEIRYRSLTSFHEFTVADDGPGIENIYHDKVFQIFQTLKARDVMESTGVGLAIVKKIIEDRGGSIRLNSTPGKGTEFIFSLPKNELNKSSNTQNE